MTTIVNGFDDQISGGWSKHVDDEGRYRKISQYLGLYSVENICRNGRYKRDIPEDNQAFPHRQDFVGHHAFSGFRRFDACLKFHLLHHPYIPPLMFPPLWLRLIWFPILQSIRRLPSWKLSVPYSKDHCLYFSFFYCIASRLGDDKFTC